MSSRITWTETNLDGTKTMWVKKTASDEFRGWSFLAVTSGVFGLIVGWLLWH
jgi:hypothetical protein